MSRYYYYNTKEENKEQERLVSFFLPQKQNNNNNNNKVLWNPELIHDNNKQCQKTLIYPFRTACPASCSKLRQQYHDNNNKTFPLSFDNPFYNNWTSLEGVKEQNDNNYYYYRVTVEWYFGNLIDYYNKNIQADTDESSWASNKWENKFKVSKSFVRNFVSASNELAKQASTRFSLSSSRNITIRKQKRIHLTLSYLCCLTKQQAMEAIRLIDKWLDSKKYSFSIQWNSSRNNSIECWHETYNSVTNILLVDSYNQQDDISSNLSNIYNLVTNVSSQYSSLWNDAGGNGNNLNGIHIQHNPKRSSKPKKHASY